MQRIGTFCVPQKEENKRRVQAENSADKKNAVGDWLELLASQDDAAWKDNLIGMGSAPHVPKLFHHNGKARTRHWMVYVKPLKRADAGVKGLVVCNKHVGDCIKEVLGPCRP